ncbi:MAG: SGNH/GDSL hydrolase family protein [Xenococcaceae cyanobacterium]
MNYKLLSTLGFSLISLLVSIPVQALSFSKAYVFGDSLSDPGNIFNVTQAVQPFTEVLGIDIPVTPPVPPYDPEGRFADGLVWVDFLARELELDLIPSTELTPNPINLTPVPGINFDFDGATAFNSVNFAYGGAQTGLFGAGDLGTLIPGILTQINSFTTDITQANRSADEDALYIIWGGANDYQIVPDANPEQTVDNLTQAVETLYSIGARNFLVPNLPDLGGTPRALLPNPPIAADILTQRTNQHNQLLEAAFVDLSFLTDINLVSLDTNTLFESILASPEDFGFTSLPPNSCLQGDPLTVGIADLTPCNNPEEQIFWDLIHPTTASHEILADFAIETLQSELEPIQSTPEPTPYLPLGLLALGWYLKKIRASFFSYPK